MRPNLLDQGAIRVFRLSYPSHIEVTFEQSQEQMPFPALPQCREILDIRFNVQTNRRPSQLVGSRPLLKIFEANLRLPAVAGIQVITLIRWDRKPGSHRDAVSVQ